MTFPTKDLPHPRACPFCAESAGYVTDVSADGWFAWAVRCGNCGAFGPWAGEKAQAVKCWEERKVVPAP